MKKIIILFILMGIACTLKAQTISRKVISNAGGTVTGGGSQITFSIGETFISSLSVATTTITQGFQQPGEQITMGSVNTSMCAGTTFNLSYSANDIGGSNTFTAQLSNAVGSFANPVNIGTLAGNASIGVISVTVPSNTLTGTGYRIRITSSSPAYTSMNNNANSTINALPVASISYGATSFCKIGNAKVTRTGQLGGTYTATPSGLSINSSTGAINLAESAAKTYTVKYSFSNASCSNVATATLTINAVPAVPAIVAERFCGPTNVASLPNGGGTYKWYSSISSSIALATSTVVTTGTYYVSDTSAGCESARASVSILVSAIPTASISYSSRTLCDNGNEEVSRIGQSGGIYSASPSGLDIDSASGKIKLKSSLLGNYIISYRFSNSFCSDITTATLSIISCNNPPEAIVADKFKVIVYPNPSAYQFSLEVESSNTEKIDVFVYDRSGRMLKYLTGNEDKPIVFGEELPAGVYLAVVQQGSSKKTVRLVKK